MMSPLWLLPRKRIIRVLWRHKGVLPLVVLCSLLLALSPYFAARLDKIIVVPSDLFWRKYLPPQAVRDDGDVIKKPKKPKEHVQNAIRAVATPQRMRTNNMPLTAPPQTDDWADELASWAKQKSEFCEGHFRAFAHEFAQLRSVVVDPHLAKGKVGGEKIADVMGQHESAEFYKYGLGFFSLPCKQLLQYVFDGDSNHLNQWVSSALDLRPSTNLKPGYVTRRNFTLAVMRYEYANLYHTMTDWYNAYLMVKFFHKSPSKTDILLIDGHPRGALDDTWDTLFNTVTRVRTLRRPVLYRDLIWTMQGYNSPLNQHTLDSVPLTEQFRSFFLKAHGVTSRRSVNCTQPQVTFIWRRDYLAHPRNPSGHVVRKIANERELVRTVRRAFPKLLVRGIQIDKFQMHEQIRFIGSTDVLIGMHGAALTYALLMPKDAGLVEFYPNYWPTSNEHFQAISRWRNIHYEQWVNSDPHNEIANHLTRIPQTVIKILVKRLLRRMCPGHDLFM